jgi:Flp pilus assembly protein TadD
MIARDPGLVAAYIGLAALADDTDGRIAPLQDGFAVNPQSSELALALGASYSKQGRYAQAIAVYERAIEARDNDLIATNLAALLLDQRDDAASHEQALQLAERFANGEQHPFNHGVLGWALHKNGDSLRAVRYLEQAVAAAPDVAQLHYYLGMAYLAMGNEVNARQSLGRSVELAERNGSPFTGLDQARREVAALEARESA